MEELQWKIEEEKQKKYEIETSRLAATKEKMVQEANICLQYTDDAYVLGEEVQNPKSEYSMNDTKIRLAKKRL